MYEYKSKEKVSAMTYNDIAELFRDVKPGTRFASYIYGGVVFERHEDEYGEVSFFAVTEGHTIRKGSVFVHKGEKFSVLDAENFHKTYEL